jgi:hypothetical protein
MLFSQTIDGKSIFVLSSGSRPPAYRPEVTAKMPDFGILSTYGWLSFAADYYM